MAGIHVEDLRFRYGTGPWIFEGLNLDLGPFPEDGFVISLMGASGCGKTTFLRLLLGIASPTSGSLVVECGSGISYLPQQAVLFDHLSSMENACYFQNVSWHRDRFDQVLVSELIEILGLQQILASDRPINDLSGGERQRLALVRALSYRPSLLLLDEPLAGLDAGVKTDFLIQLQLVVSNLGVVAIYVTHQATEAEFIADQVVFLLRSRESGAVRSAAKGSLDELRDCPPSLEAASALNFPHGNVLNCALIEKNDSDIMMSTEIAEQDEPTSIFFGPSIVQKAGPGQGWKATVVAKKGSFTYLKLNDGQLLRGPASAFHGAEKGAVTQVRLNGDAFMFRALQDKVSRVSLKDKRILVRTSN